MYGHTLDMNIAGAEAGITEPIDRYGVRVFINSDPDYVSCAFKIEEEDTEGIRLFREFATKMHEHYKSLQDGR